MTRSRLFFAAFLIAAAAIAASPAPVRAQEAAPAAHPAGAEAAHEGAEAADSWKPAIAKTVNFVLLIGVLAYFLRAPLMGYLDGRIGKVREDLVAAKQTREMAVRQLGEIDARLQALPAELEALKTRGAEDLAAERVSIEQDAQVERQRVLEHTRREIDMRLRVAKRELIEVAANLAVTVASERIRASITPADQARLVDRYAAQLPGGSDRGAGAQR